MMTRTKLLLPIAATPMFVLFVLQACGGDSNNGNDASTDGTTGGDATPDVAQDVQGNDSSACPTYTGSVEFCKASIARCNACPGSVNINSCQRQNLDAVCNAAGNIFSAQFASAATACETVCDSDASNACEKNALADASLTTTQQKLVTDYCTRCSTDAGACGAQLAPSIVQYSDTIVTTIDQTCAPDAGGPDSSACKGFNTCAGTQLLGALNSLPCADAASD
ncbi:MAG TPA: hypothetical protein VGH87_14165 [Polyangiaceae bacterium]